MASLVHLPNDVPTGSPDLNLPGVSVGEVLVLAMLDRPRQNGHRVVIATGESVNLQSSIRLQLFVNLPGFLQSCKVICPQLEMRMQADCRSPLAH